MCNVVFLLASPSVRVPLEQPLSLGSCVEQSPLELPISGGTAPSLKVLPQHHVEWALGSLI